MPNISINKSDLADLGISLKDILLAITKSKNSNGDVIRIKRKKPKNNRKRNQFSKHPKQPKFSRTGGGGGGGSSMINTVPSAPNVTNVMTSGSSDKDNQINSMKEQQNYIKHQIDDFKRDNEMKLITQQNQLSNFQNMSHLGMRLIYDKIGNPLSNIQSDSFRPKPVDKTDSFGIIPNYDFYDNTSRVQVIDESQIPEQPIEPEQQQLPEPASFDSALQQEVQREEKKKGRPKGSRNKPKEHPLAKETIEKEMELPNTRSSNNPLLNAENITPDRVAKEHKEQMKKQEVIMNYFMPNSSTNSFTPRKIKEPIRVVPENGFSLEDENGDAFPYDPNAMKPTPPTESKPSKFKSRLPIPEGRRSKSEGLIFG